MRTKKAYLLYYALGLSLILLASTACKRTKDSFTSRTYHRMVSKFNPLFNGEQALLKGVNTLENARQYDFDEILDVYLVPTERQAGSVKPDMDRAVEKGAKVIQEHSMLIRNKQKNSFIDDSYLLIGKARFYKRDFLLSLETFNYLIQEYEDEKAADEARVWAAKSLIETGNYLSAKGNVERVYRKKSVDKDIKVEALAVFAQIEISQKKYEGATQLLSQAIEKTSSKENEVRWLFIMGQLHAKMGNYNDASEYFRQVIKKGPPYELLFQAQLNRAKNYDVDLQNPNKVFDELRAMLRDDKNYDNRDQIYYVMAEVSERLEEDAKVEEFLGKSIRVSTNNNTQKGLSYLKFGEINFENKLYTTAAAYYDSAYTTLPKDHKRYEEVRVKKESLGELVENITIIETQDSLQRLAGLTEKQRLAFVEKLIEDLEEADRKAAEAEADGQALTAFNNLNSGPGGGGPSTPTAGGFYFYNTNLRSSGLRDFRNQFGNRKLEDNWRREDKQSTGNFNIDDQNDEATAESSSEGGESKYKADDFIARIPLTDSAMAESHQQITDAYVAIGRIYKEELKDYRAASKELETLLKRYPDLDIKARIWYTLYRIYVLGEDEKQANKYKNLILSEFPESEYAALILNEGKPIEEISQSAVRQLYVQAYEAYETNDFKQALSLATEGVSKYAESTFGPRFFLLRAYALARSPESDKLKLALQAVVERFPDSEEAKKANSILAQIDEPLVGKNANPKTAEGALYTYDAKAPHRYILIVPNLGVDMNNLRNDLSNFNTTFFKLNKLNSRAIFLDQENQMMIVNTFASAEKALNYYNTLINQKVLLKYLPAANTKHFVISNDNFQKFYKNKGVEQYQEFFGENYLKKK